MKLESDRLLTRSDLALRWGCSLSTIKRYEKKGLLKVIRIGPRLIRFKLDDVLDVERGIDSLSEYIERQVVNNTH